MNFRNKFFHGHEKIVHALLNITEILRVYERNYWVFVVGHLHEKS